MKRPAAEDRDHSPNPKEPGMIRFKLEAIEKLMEERKPEINLTTYQHIKKTVENGAEGMAPYTLSNMCRDLNCLPTDIIEYV